MRTYRTYALNADSCLSEDPDAPSGDSINYKLTQWSRKKSVLNWFNAGCAKDSTAELWVDVPSKDARKDIHLCVSLLSVTAGSSQATCKIYPLHRRYQHVPIHVLYQAGLCRMVSKDFRELKSLSRGIDGQRRLLVIHSSNTKWDLGPLSAEDETKARVLLATLRDQQGSDQQGSTWSVDEAKEMVALNTMPGDSQLLSSRYVSRTKVPLSLLSICCRKAAFQTQSVACRRDRAASGQGDG